MNVGAGNYGSGELDLGKATWGASSKQMTAALRLLGAEIISHHCYDRPTLGRNEITFACFCPYIHVKM